MTKLLPVVFLAMMAAPAFAQTTAPKTAATEEKQSDMDRIVCKRHEEIGSRLGARKVCMTVSQWKEQERLYREQVQKFQQMGTVYGSSG